MGVPPPGIRNDALALVEFMRNHTASEISGDVNAWIMLVEGTGMRMKRSASLGDREAFREAALLAVGRARSAAVAPSWYWLHHATWIRASYVQSGDKDRQWNEREAESIYDDFTADVPFDADRMSDFLSGRGSLPITAGSELLGWLALSVGAMSGLLEFLPALKRAEAEKWLSLKEQIAHFT